MCTTMFMLLDQSRTTQNMWQAFSFKMILSDITQMAKKEESTGVDWMINHLSPEWSNNPLFGWIVMSVVRDGAELCKYRKDEQLYYDEVRADSQMVASIRSWSETLEGGGGDPCGDHLADVSWSSAVKWSMLRFPFVVSDTIGMSCTRNVPGSISEKLYYT